MDHPRKTPQPKSLHDFDLSLGRGQNGIAVLGEGQTFKGQQS